jgi:hypothetical protein
MKIHSARLFAGALAAGLFGAGILAGRCSHSVPANVNQVKSGTAAYSHNPTKFQTSPPPASKIELTESVDAVEQRMAEQVGKVETARLKMMECMKKHSIIDVPPLELERELAALNKYAAHFRGLEGTELIEAWVEHNVESSSITRVYPEYRAGIAQLNRVEEDGLAEDDPKVKALKESILSKYQRLEAHAKAHRDKLEERLSSLRTSLAREEEGQLRPLSAAEKEAQNEYARLKQSYEHEIEGLNTLWEIHTRVSVEAGVRTKPVPSTP